MSIRFRVRNRKQTITPNWGKMRGWFWLKIDENCHVCSHKCVFLLGASFISMRRNRLLFSEYAFQGFTAASLIGLSLRSNVMQSDPVFHSKPSVTRRQCSYTIVLTPSRKILHDLITVKASQVAFVSFPAISDDLFTTSSQQMPRARPPSMRTLIEDPVTAHGKVPSQNRFLFLPQA